MCVNFKLGAKIKNLFGILIRYSNKSSKSKKNRLKADNDATYFKKLTLDLATVTPYVSGPNSVKVASSIADLEAKHIKIQKAYLVSCTNSRVSDIIEAANAFCCGTMTLEGAPYLDEKHLPVFD